MNSKNGFKECITSYQKNIEHYQFHSVIKVLETLVRSDTQYDILLIVHFNLNPMGGNWGLGVVPAEGGDIGDGVCGMAEHHAPVDPYGDATAVR